MKPLFAIAATISLLAAAGAMGRSSLSEAGTAASGGKFDVADLSAEQVQRLQAKFQYWRSDTETQMLVAR